MTKSTTAPTYNHSREDSALTPCPLCAPTAWLPLDERRGSYLVLGGYVAEVHESSDRPPEWLARVGASTQTRVGAGTQRLLFDWLWHGPDQPLAARPLAHYFRSEAAARLAAMEWLVAALQFALVTADGLLEALPPRPDQPPPVAAEPGPPMMYGTDDGMYVCDQHARELDLRFSFSGPFEVLPNELAAPVRSRCVICSSNVRPSSGRTCVRQGCGKPLHPRWPAVYCSNRCAMMDATAP